MSDKTKSFRQKETTRLEAFSDGVFSIAITLLVLELISTLHPASEEGIIATCLEHWRSFLAFFIGFVTILVCWLNHHLALEYVKKIDTRFIWINGFLLFVVTLTPFPTAILAEYLEKEGTTAMAIFGFNYFLIAVAADRICSYAYRHHLIDETDRKFYSAYKQIYRISIVYTLLAFFICFVSVVAAVILYLFLFIAFASPKELAMRLERLRMKKH